MALKTFLSVLVLMMAAACGDATVETAPVATDSPTTAPATTDMPPTTVAPTTTVAPATTSDPTTTAGPAGDCSAAGMTAGAAPQDLPPAVAATRQRIVDLAIACDYEGLAALAAEAPFFTFGFGGDDDPVSFWRESERQGDPVTRLMVELLDLPVGVIEQVDPPVYSWPELTTIVEPTDADYDQVRGIYDEDEIEIFKQFGGYTGYRAGIQADGAWLYFVAGD